MGAGITIGGVTCHELNGSGRITTRRDGMKGVRLFRVAGSDAPALMAALCGYSEPGVGEESHIYPPAEWPDISSLKCVECEAEPFEASTTNPLPTNQLIDYKWMRVSARYETASTNGNASEDGGLIEESYDLTAEFMALPPRDDYVLTTMTTSYPLETFAPQRLMPGVEYTFTKKRLATVPFGTIFAALGTVNGATWRLCNASCALFIGAGARSGFDSSGRRVWDVSFKFQIRGFSWNKFLAPNGQPGDLMRDDGGGMAVVNLYTVYNFELLVSSNA